MKKALKAKWVAALRSGEYAKGKEALCENDKYCCLGVLLQIADPKGWSDEKGGDGCWGHRFAAGETLSTEARTKFGIPDAVQPDLIAMNDGIDQKAKSFKQIADHIEKADW